MEKKSLLYNIWNNKANIIKGILNRIYTKKEVKLLANERLAICKTCPYNSDNTDKRPYGKLPYTHCTACGCSLSVKPYVPEAECPKGKWEQMISPGYLLNTGWKLADPPYIAPNASEAALHVPFEKDGIRIYFFKHDLIILRDREILFQNSYRDINNFELLIKKYGKPTN